MSGARGAIALGAALLLVAGIFDAEPLYVPAVAFAALGAGCLAWVASGARGLRVGRTLVAPRVVEDDPLPVEILLETSQVALPTCTVIDPLLDSPVTVAGGRRSATVDVEARFPRRGRQELPPPTVIVRDPLGLARRELTGDRHDEILVLPRVEPVRAAKARALMQGRDHALPDDVQELAPVVLSHRIVLAPEALDVSAGRVVADALAATPAM